MLFKKIKEKLIIICINNKYKRIKIEIYHKILLKIPTIIHNH